MEQIRSISSMKEEVKKGPLRRVAIVCANDLNVLQAMDKASAEGIAEAVLFGQSDEISKIISENNLKIDAEIIHAETDAEAADAAVKTVAEGRAHILMKGFLPSNVFLKAILKKEGGLRTDSLLSHLALMESDHYDRLVFSSDGAMIITPTLEEKVMIINNTVSALKCFGIDNPKVAALCAVETVNPRMPATVDASILTMMNKRGQIKNCSVDGPLALDNALSPEAAHHKKIDSEVAGQADFLLCPTIEVANGIYKGHVFLDGGKGGCIILGAGAPIVLTSRADTVSNKVNSIAFAGIAAGC